jgi:hypothetical protein
MTRLFARVSLAIEAYVALACAAPASARSDEQLWGTVIASGTVRGNLFLWMEGQARATDGLGGGSQFFLRPAIGARIGQDAHAVVGYVYSRTDPEDGTLTNEHRLWQQVQFVPARTKRGTPLVISRTRLEQRMFEGQDGTGWRLRQFIKLQVPIARVNGLQAIAITEGFINLNNTRAGVRRGPDQWRTFGGVGFPVANRTRLEVGYLNQRIFRSGEDRVNHVLSATVFLQL